MLIDIYLQRSWNEIQWLDSESDYLAHLNVIATEAFPKITDLVTCVTHEKWEEGMNFLNLLIKDLSAACYLKTECNLVTDHASSDQLKLKESSSDFVQKILRCIYLFEQYKLIESGHFVEVDIGIIAQAIARKEFETRLESLYLRGNVLYPTYTIFGYENTLRKIHTQIEIAPQLAMKSFLALIGYNNKIIQNFLLDFDSDALPELVLISATDTGNSPPPVIVEDKFNDAFQSLRVGNKSKISFHRTLRVPEDGIDYPLPAGLGTIPIHRVEDYAQKVPHHWLEEGGFFIPLYQKEALFIQLEGEDWCPSIAKVCVGEINAINGKPFSEMLSTRSQDYVVIPNQKWLDGVNSGDGIVRQFVAMPLGQGYTIEAQITDEEKYGGFQIIVYEPVEGIFASSQKCFQKKAEYIVAACRKKFDSLLKKSDFFVKMIVIYVQEGKTIDEIITLTCLPEEEVKILYDEFRTKFYDDTFIIISLHVGSDGNLAETLEAVRSKLKLLGVARDIAPPLQKDATLNASPTHSGLTILMSSPVSPSTGSIVKEMGIAAGGKIEQKIVRDTYGVDTWDVNRRRLLKLHIVNSACYKEITGQEPPPSPITVEHYQKSGIPWYSNYDETAQEIKGAAAFKRILGIDEIDKRRGVVSPPSLPRPLITPELIQKIKTPDVNEAAIAFRNRASENIDAERWKTAIREIDYLIDLGCRVEARDYSLRALCNFNIKRFLEAIMDSESALIIDSDFGEARTTRARCRLALGDHLGGLEDAEYLLKIPETELAGLELRAESHLHMGRYKDAVYDALSLGKKAPGHQRASEILDEARRRANQQFHESMGHD